MNEQQITLVQESFEQVRPIADVAAAMFYDYLFLLDPELRRMFPADLSGQGKMLMSVLGSAVCGLNNPQALVPVLKQLGRRHVGYGVQDEHYDVVGAALILTLETGLADSFTEEVADAWRAAYDLIATVMKEGAHEVYMPLAA